MPRTFDEYGREIATDCEGYCQQRECGREPALTAHWRDHREWNNCLRDYRTECQRYCSGGGTGSGRSGGATYSGRSGGRHNADW